jgi:lysophospholipid hydrolase
VFTNLENQASDSSLPISSNSSVTTPDISPKNSHRRRLSSFGSTNNTLGSRKFTKKLFTTPMKVSHLQGKSNFFFLKKHSWYSMTDFFSP